MYLDYEAEPRNVSHFDDINGTAVEPLILDHKEKLYMIYEIEIHTKLNGKDVTMILDTGSDFSVISGNDVSKLGLGELPVSKILYETEKMVAVDVDIAVFIVVVSPGRIIYLLWIVRAGAVTFVKCFHLYNVRAHFPYDA